MEYPRTLYKRSEEGTLDFTNKKHRHIKYDSLVVEDEKELKAAVEMGYVDGFEDALFGDPKPKKKPAPEPEEKPSMKIEAGF